MGKTRVVVTGLGASTPLGGDVASTWDALLAGKSGMRTLPWDNLDAFPVQFAAQAAVEPADTGLLAKPQMRRMDRCQQFALIAAIEAMKHAGYAHKDTPGETVDPDRLGVVLSSGIGGLHSALDSYDVFREKGWRRVSPFTVPMLMPNGSAAHVGLEFNATAGIHALVSACSSSAEAIGYAIDMIRSGRADVVIAGGTDGTSTPLGDVAELNGIKGALGEHARKINITATKSMTGHLLGGAGALESLITVLSLREGLVPAVANLENLDDQVDLDIVMGEPRKLPDGPAAALNNSFGFGGHNVTLAFERAL